MRVIASMKLPSFNAVLLDSQGRISSHKLEAASVDQARAIAVGRGHTVLECTPAQASGSWLSVARLPLYKRGAELDTVAFSQDLATLMEAGVTVKDGVDALARREQSPARRVVLDRVNALVSEGLSFSAALDQTHAFPDLLVATVAASEQTGDVAIGLARYAKHQQSLRLVRDRFIAAGIYPMLLLGVGSLVMLVLLGIVVPRFARIIDAQGRDLPFFSKLLMGWGSFVDAHPVVPICMFAAFIAAVIFGLTQWKRPEVRKRWLEKVPGVARLVREFQHLQMYRTTAILTSRGITVHRALLYSLDLLSPSDRVRLQASLERMREGATISDALSGCGLSDVVATSMLSVAERSGALPEMLDRIADFYERSLQRNIEIVSRLIEPLLMIIFGIVIGGIVILMYLPIFDLAASVS
jgi:general secretion pathway protein F